MKKITVVLIAMVMVISLMPASVAANTAPIRVAVNGTLVNFTGQQPVNVSGRILVPVRGVFETLGFTVSWDAPTQSATLTNPTYTVIIRIGATTFTTNGITFPLDVPAQILNDTTMLPLRAVLESTGNTLTWDANTHTVHIFTSDTVVQTTPPAPTAILDPTLGDPIDLSALLDASPAAPSSHPDTQAAVNPIELSAQPSEYVFIEAEVYDKIIAMKAEYPQGMKWTDDDYISGRGYWYTGCAAFAKILSDSAFGSLPSRFHNDIDKIRIGDVLRLSHRHSVVVLSIDATHVTVAEGNFNASINWGRKIAISRLTNLVEKQWIDDYSYTWSGGEVDVTVETRYPE
jgi:hypothetical protein